LDIDDENPEDNTTVYYLDYNHHEPLELAGEEFEVRLNKGLFGKVSIKTVDGKDLSHEAGAIANSVPLMRAEYRYVRYNPPQQQLYQCIINTTNNEYYGDDEAWWWNLSSAIVTNASGPLLFTKVSQRSLLSMMMMARVAWEDAFEKLGENDIARLRDTTFPNKIAFYNTYNSWKKKEKSEAKKIGISIGMATIAAMLSGDPNLERYAFQNFGSYVWKKGTEPPELLRYAAE
jgi:hypothetical protein